MSERDYDEEMCDQCGQTCVDYRHDANGMHCVCCLYDRAVRAERQRDELRSVVDAFGAAALLPKSTAPEDVYTHVKSVADSWGQHEERLRTRHRKLREAWKMMREEILHERGPLEVNEILGIIDSHFPSEGKEQDHG